MKILTLSNSLLEESQGSGYVIMGYARRLRERGHQVDVLGPGELSNLRYGLRAIRYRQMIGMAAKSIGRLTEHYDIYEFYGGEAWLAIELLRRIKKRPFLVAHSNGLEPLAIQLLRKDLKAGRGKSRSWYQLDLTTLYGRSFSGADAVVTVSEFDRKYALQKRYQPEHRLLAIENSLPDAYLNQPLVHERPPAAVFCGTWIPRKGVALLVRDANAFLQAYPEWRLVLVGVGRDFRVGEHFSPSIARRIEVIPSIDRERGLRDIYLRCRIVIQASTYESFGLVAAEAMACGCALVATRVGFADSLVDDEEALLLSAPESPHLAACLSRLAADENLRRRIAAGGHRRVQILHWESAVNRLEAAYQTWMHDRQGMKQGCSAVQ